MVNIEKIDQHVSRVKEAGLGEIILFSESRRRNAMYPFEAKLGVYRGFVKDTYYQDGRRKIHATLRNVRNVSLSIEKVHGIYVPHILGEPSNCTSMGLRDNGEVFVGPDEISEHLKDRGMGFFDDFFMQYVQRYGAYPLSFYG
nr:hypothetical protein [Nanoarchaeum sp.]